MEQTYQEISLDKLAPNQLNPRKKFSGPKFDELVDSIRQKGVIEPILVRPADNGKPFEIVAGERRYRAAIKVAKENGGPRAYKIPALVRPLSDDEAFDIMCIENLQREDLTELEEAEGFKTYLNKKGEEALPELAERTGINPRYIRRRVSILNLPEKTLKAWEKGELRYGHLEQLHRMKDKKRILDYTREIIESRGGYSVHRLKANIDDMAPALKAAKWNIEKSGCQACHQNSETQKRLFDMGDMKGAYCLDPKCFKRHQNNWLLSNWKKTGYRKQHGTNGFRFNEDLAWNDWNTWYTGKPPKKCRECHDFVSLIRLVGDVVNGQVCIGDKACFAKSPAQSASNTSSKEKKQEKKPPAWHGTYFREQFYKEQLPLRLQANPVDDVKTARVMLFSLLKSNNELHGWFAVKRCGKKRRDTSEWWEYSLDTKKIWNTVAGMERDQVMEDLKEASIEVVMQDQYSAESRRLIADHMGISLQEEWQVTPEWFSKKTIKEILAFGEASGIFADKKAQTFLYEKLLKKRGRFESCKKDELVSVFMESGVELKGKVPAEILGK